MEEELDLEGEIVGGVLTLTHVKEGLKFSIRDYDIIHNNEEVFIDQEDDVDLNSYIDNDFRKDSQGKYYTELGNAE